MIDPDPWSEVLPQLPTPYFNGLPLDGRIERVEEHAPHYFQTDAVKRL